MSVSMNVGRFFIFILPSLLFWFSCRSVCPLTHCVRSWAYVYTGKRERQPSWFDDKNSNVLWIPTIEKNWLSIIVIRTRTRSRYWLSIALLDVHDRPCVCVCVCVCGVRGPLTRSRLVPVARRFSIFYYLVSVYVCRTKRRGDNVRRGLASETSRFIFSPTTTFEKKNTCTRNPRVLTGRWGGGRGHVRVKLLVCHYNNSRCCNSRNENVAGPTLADNVCFRLNAQSKLYWMYLRINRSIRKTVLSETLFIICIVFRNSKTKPNGIFSRMLYYEKSLRTKTENRKTCQMTK